MQNVIQLVACGYLVVANLVAFVAYGLDKHKARRHRWRIPEATLLWMAALGGSLGAWLGMNVWHHKTQHLRFRLIVPLCLVLHLFLICYFLSQVSGKSF